MCVCVFFFNLSFFFLGDRTGRGERRRLRGCAGGGPSILLQNGERPCAPEHRRGFAPDDDEDGDDELLYIYCYASYTLPLVAAFPYLTRVMRSLTCNSERGRCFAVYIPSTVRGVWSGTPVRVRVCT